MIRFDVLGLPAPQGSKSAVVVAGRARVIEGRRSSGRERHKSWRTAVAEAAAAETERRGGPIAEPVAVTVTFRMPPPKSDPYRTRHATKPDIDKLLRSVLDALVVARLLADDALVWDARARKVYARGAESVGATVEIVECGEAERADREQLKQATADARRQTKGAVA